MSVIRFISFVGVVVTVASCGSGSQGQPLDHLRPVVTATESLRTARVAVMLKLKSINGDVRVNAGTGTVAFSNAAIEMTITRERGEQSAHVLCIEEACYIDLARIGSRRLKHRWAMMAGANLADAPNAISLATFPLSYLSMLGDALTRPVPLGRRSIKGEYMLGYKLDVSVDGLPRTTKINTAMMKSQARLFGSPTILLRVWIDRRNLVRRIDVTSNLVAAESERSVMTIDFWDFDVPEPPNTPLDHEVLKNAEIAVRDELP